MTNHSGGVFYLHNALTATKKCGKRKKEKNREMVAAALAVIATKVNFTAQRFETANTMIATLTYLRLLLLTSYDKNDSHRITFPYNSSL